MLDFKIKIFGRGRLLSFSSLFEKILKKTYRSDLKVAIVDLSKIINRLVSIFIELNMSNCSEKLNSRLPQLVKWVVQ